MKYEELDVYEAPDRIQDYAAQKRKVQNLTNKIKRLTKKLHEQRAILALLVPDTNSQTYEQIVRQPEFKLTFKD